MTGTRSLLTVVRVQRNNGGVEAVKESSVDLRSALVAISGVQVDSATREQRSSRSALVGDGQRREEGSDGVELGVRVRARSDELASNTVGLSGREGQLSHEVILVSKLALMPMSETLAHQVSGGEFIAVDDSIQPGVVTRLDISDGCTNCKHEVQRAEDESQGNRAACQST